MSEDTSASELDKVFDEIEIGDGVVVEYVENPIIDRHIGYVSDKTERLELRTGRNSILWGNLWNWCTQMGAYYEEIKSIKIVDPVK